MQDNFFGRMNDPSATTPEEAARQVFSLYPVGVVEKSEKHESRLRFFDSYVDALDGLEDFSHAFVLYWFDGNDTPRKAHNHLHNKGLHTLDELQTDLDTWLRQYNESRPHSGKYCFGKTPTQTFPDSVTLAKEKMLNQTIQTAAHVA